MTNNQGGHLQKIDIFIKAFNLLSQGANFSLKRGSLIDELLRIIT